MRHLERALERRRRELVLAHLLVATGERCERPQRRTFRHHALEQLGRLLLIAQIRVHQRETGEGVLVLRVDLECLLVGGFGVRRVVLDLAQPSEHQPGIDILGIQLDDLRVLLDRLLHHVFLDAVLARIADQPRKNPAQNAPGIHVVRIRLDRRFVLFHRRADLSGLDKEVRQFFAQKAGVRIRFDRGAIKLDRLVQILAAVTVHRGQLRVKVRHREVVISGRLVIFLVRRGRCRCGRRRSRRRFGGWGLRGRGRSILLPSLRREAILSCCQHDHCQRYCLRTTSDLHPLPIFLSTEPLVSISISPAIPGPVVRTYVFGRSRPRFRYDFSPFW